MYAYHMENALQKTQAIKRYDNSCYFIMTICNSFLMVQKCNNGKLLSSRQSNIDFIQNLQKGFITVEFRV